MASAYPGSLDTFSTAHADGIGEIIHASTVNDLADAVNKIEQHVQGPIFNVRAYGAVGDGTTNDTSAIQAAANAWLTAKRGTLYFPKPSVSYRITSTIVITLGAHAAGHMTVTGSGAIIDYTGVTSGPAFQFSSATFSWTWLIIEKLYFLANITSGASDAIKLVDGTSGASFFYKFQVRDCVIDTKVGNGIHLTGNFQGLFEYQIVNNWVDLTGNVLGVGILVDGTSTANSSAEFYHNNTRGGLNGMVLGTTSAPIRANIVGGTYLAAQTNGIKAYIQGGNILHPHLEGNWLSAANQAAGGGGIYLEGWANVHHLEEYRTGGLTRWGIDLYSTGPTTIAGMPAGNATYPYVRVRQSVTGGSVALSGVPVNEVDSSGVSGQRTPAIDFWVPKGMLSLTYGTTIATDCALADTFRVVVTNATAFTISNPTNARSGQRITYIISNSSGGAMGAITWGGEFSLAGAFVNPATGKSRLIEFVRYATGGPDTGAWLEESRTAADL